MKVNVGNQLPILLIDFETDGALSAYGWESVTNPLDRLLTIQEMPSHQLGISYQSS